MSWFQNLTRRIETARPERFVPLGPPFASEEDPYGSHRETRLLRRPARWEVVDEIRGARLEGTGEAFLSLQRLRLALEAGGAAQVPLHCVSGERYEQPIFGCNYLSGAAELDGRRVTFNVFFERGGSTAFITVFFRALRLARSGVELESIDEPTARAHAAFAHATMASDTSDISCVWADAEPVPTATADGEAPGARLLASPTARLGGDIPTATAVRTGLSHVNQQRASS